MTLQVGFWIRDLGGRLRHTDGLGLKCSGRSICGAGLDTGF